MAFTYTGDPSRNLRDAVRFQIDDTDPQDFQFEDGEIDFVVRYFGLDPEAAGVAEGSVFSAALELLRIKERRLSADPTVRIGNFSIDNTAAAKATQELIKKLQARLAARQGLYAGGISVADKEAAQADADRSPDAFRQGIHDFPGTGLNKKTQTNDPTTNF